VVTILALAAAVLYGTADFLGGVASRRASAFAVLAVTVPAGAVVVVAVALLGEAPWLGGLLGHGAGSSTLFGDWGAIGWAAASGVCGSSGLIAFYAGFAAAPISVVAPVAALVSTVLPVGVAIADGERLTPQHGRRRPDLPGRHRHGQHAAGPPERTGQGPPAREPGRR
jgi:hypothetical protein